MSLMLTLLLTVQVISALAIILLVLLQQGKGADMGSAFGGGSAGSLFGATGAANFLSRATKWAAVVFFCTTAGLAWVGHRGAATSPVSGGVMEGFQPVDRSVPQVPGAPVLPGDASVPSIPAAPADVTPPAAPAAEVPAASAPAAAAPATGSTSEAGASVPQSSEAAPATEKPAS